MIFAWFWGNVADTRETPVTPLFSSTGVWLVWTTKSAFDVFRSKSDEEVLRKNVRVSVVLFLNMAVVFI
jgi:hypothetical protein